MKTGELIKELRLKKGLTQEELATKTDVSARTIQRIENSEVGARSFTLQSIATALQVNFETLNESSNLNPTQAGSYNVWIPLLHLSGLFNLLIPPLLIWLIKRKHVKGMDGHGIAVTNFQLSIILYIIIALLPAICIPSVLYVHVRPILVVITLFSTAITLTNVIRVFYGQQYNYPLTIQIIRPKS